MSLLMPFSPLDALINALPDVRRAGRPGSKDTVIDTLGRIADIYRPIVKKIQDQAYERAAFVAETVGVKAIRNLKSGETGL